MNDPFDQIKNLWFSVNPDMLPDLENLQAEIAQLRKQKKSRLLLWYSGLIAFSVLVMMYVIYTDELNSLYQSISEFILLFTSVFLFRNAWKNITAQKREYLLNNRDFIESIAGNEKTKKRGQVREYCICVSLLILSVFLYFLKDMLVSEKLLIAGLILLLASNVTLWLLLKPYYEKTIIAENQMLISRIEKLLTEYK